MSAKLVDLPTPAPKQKMPPWKSFGALILMMFVLGFAIGSCSLGMKLPVALYEMATGPK